MPSASHVRWKITLLLAARMREPLSERATRSIQHPEECAIRKWLLSEHTLAPARHAGVPGRGGSAHGVSSQMLAIAT